MNLNEIEGRDLQQTTLITVGLASYDRPTLLARAIQSIKNQEYQNLEILISDNGSTDPEVIRLITEFAESDSRVKYVFHPLNRGPFFNFRSLLEQARGEYFIWLADDDYWSEKFLTNLVRKAKLTNAALTYGKAYIVDIDLIDTERWGKELRTTRQGWLSLVRFICFDADSIIYGLFKTETGRKLSPLLKEWTFSNETLTQFGFLAYNFPSYPFVYGLLASGGFCNASDEETIHFVGGRQPYENRPNLTVQHARLLYAYFSMHVQMTWRYIHASFKVKSISGIVISPVAGSYLFVRRIFVALRNRKNRV